MDVEVEANRVLLEDFWLIEQFCIPAYKSAVSIIRNYRNFPSIQAHDVSVPQAKSDWYEAFSSMTRKELRAVETDIVENVFGVTIDR